MTTGRPARLGVVYDIDGVLRVAPLRRQWGRLRALVAHGPRDRRSLLGMQRVLHVLADADPPADVHFLTALPIELARPLTAALRHDQYPGGTVLMAGRALLSGWLFGAGLERKRETLDRLAARHPDTHWVLVGDDAGHGPELFGGFARDHPDRVAAIAMRRLLDVEDASTRADDGGPPVVTAPNGEEMLPGLRAVLGLDEAGGAPRIDDWFLTDAQRGNPATRLRAWTDGNDVRPRVHGSVYYRALADRLATTGTGDQVLFLGWRGDGDQQLTDRGPTVAQALASAARRGARVCGLLWRSHLSAIGYHVERNRRLAADLRAAGGEVLLDQRVRPLGSHHQKLVVIRRDTDPRDDVAYVGGIDLVLGARDDIVHRGDPQSSGAANAYDRDPRHDAQLELRGPVVRDLHEVFFERWVDPTPLVRLPWHVVPDLVHRLPLRGSPLPVPAPDPPPAGRCAVQVLRTYPRRTPPLPFAPWGERSVARAFIKALGRARRIVYVEDQYLWSADVARVFAAALRRAPQLHLVAVVPRPHRDARPGPAVIGQAEAIAMVHEAGGDRVQILDVENDEASPVYVHAKVCVVDDVWATVGSNNFNTRSWTHDSELVTAILDDERDRRAPVDPGGLGDGARGFARRLRLELMREHLGLADDTAILDPDQAAGTVRARAAALDAWHAAGARGARPPGRLRRHTPAHEQVEVTRRRRWITGPAYRMVLDPDGRPLRARLQRTY
ncbi:phosphatase domain-containing protein [Actinomycetospora cinnamomea]|uniref:phosphatase domain-containing protein n=1 Tax=Actinomycetospora cinnamomea TaxID=663609 RepID=UPI001A9C7292|nr:phosphatase domain-containing protein [Actinomycetospora cinnamomea]